MMYSITVCGIVIIAIAVHTTLLYIYIAPEKVCFTEAKLVRAENNMPHLELYSNNIISKLFKC